MVYIRLHSGNRANRLSWHILSTWTRVPGRGITVCGRAATGEFVDSFGQQKTCETCLRRKVQEG